jgi:hypothetical protein
VEEEEETGGEHHERWKHIAEGVSAVRNEESGDEVDDESNRR